MNIIYGMGRLQRLLHNNEYVGPPFFEFFCDFYFTEVEVEVNRTYGESEFGLKDCLQSAAFLPFLPAPTDPTCFKSDIVILKQFTDTNFTYTYSSLPTKSYLKSI